MLNGLLREGAACVVPAISQPRVRIRLAACVKPAAKRCLLLLISLIPLNFEGSVQFRKKHQTPRKPKHLTPSQLLWSMTELIAAGAPPPLSPGGAEWARLVEGYSHAAEVRGHDKKAASFYREAVSRLSAPGGRGGQCVSRQLAQRCMAQLSVGR
jgi:hypothetical protein